MTNMLDCVDKLAGEIGARPVGTDEEQQAAFFIEETLKSETNFEVEVQEFDAVRNPEIARAVPSGLTFVGCVLAFVLSSVPVVPLLLTLAGGVLFALNELGIFSLAPYFGKAPSQNVVAKHNPAVEGARKKKIVILTNYDSDKVHADEASGFFSQLGHIKMFELGAVAVAFLGSLIAFFAGGNFFVTLLLVLGLIGSALPIVALIIHTTGKFSVGANNNASSVAVMLEAAKRISTGVYAPHGETPVIHGKVAAKLAGAIPDETNVSWETGDALNADATSAVESMFFNKKRTSEDNEPEPLAQQSVEVEGELEPLGEQAVQQVVTYEPQAEPAPAPSSAPDWFTRGKEKAGDKGNTNAGRVKRSTFGDAFDSVEKNVTAGQTAKSEESDLQKKLQAIQNQIAETSAVATDNVASDANVAEKVLDNELKEQVRQNETKEQTRGVSGYLEKETAAADFEASQEVKPRQTKTSVASSQKKDEVPELKPLEPEYGVEVDPSDFLDRSKTAKMGVVETSANEVVSAPEPKAVEAPKREIALPSLTGALESKKVNERLQREKEAEEKHQKENAQVQSRISVNLPSLTSEVSEKKNASDENKTVSNVGAFGVGEATGTFAPITDEDLRRANEGNDDIYVYDADDSALQETTTDSGAVAGPGYVDIPDTHAESIFGKLFHKKDKGSDDSLASSIGVDDSYEARSVGKHRGDWSSFSDDAWDDDDWNGGAVVIGGEEDKDVCEDVNERDEIYNFATNDVGAEIWCVALGAEASNHSGLQNFLETNASDLKGAKFITLDAMGSGEISVVETEGVFKPQSVQTRMKRFTRDASKTLGISVKGEKMLWKETTSSKLGAKGHKYVHLAGFDGGKPALLSSEKDTFEALSEDVLKTSADYLMELVRTL